MGSKKRLRIVFDLPAVVINMWNERYDRYGDIKAFGYKKVSSVPSKNVVMRAAYSPLS